MLRCKTVDCHATIFSLHGHDGSSGGRAGHDRGETAKACSHRATAIMFIILWHTRVRTCEYLHLASPFRPCSGHRGRTWRRDPTASSNALPPFPPSTFGHGFQASVSINIGRFGRRRFKKLKFWWDPWSTEVRSGEVVGSRTSLVALVSSRSVASVLLFR